MDDLVEWLRAQLDEDERVALAVREEYRSWWQDGLYPETGPRKVVSTYGHLMAQPPVDIAPEIAEHIGRHDPARVLREVEAKRILVALAVELAMPMPMPPNVPAAAAKYEAIAEEAERKLSGHLLRTLALPYSDRPGYREEWRP